MTSVLAAQTRCYSYDRALAVIASLDGPAAESDRLVTELLDAQIADGPNAGLWYFWVDCQTGKSADPYIRNGANAWSVYALSLYGKQSAHKPLVTRAKVAIVKAIDALQGFMSGGLLTLGIGAYGDDGKFNGDQQTGAATEHNLDFWWALDAADVVLPANGYAAMACRLSETIFAKLWLGDRFAQGYSLAGADRGQALDVYSWGALWLAAQDGRCQASKALDGIKLFATKGGYSAYIGDAPWTEGEAGVVLAEYRLKGTITLSKEDDGLVAGKFWQKIVASPILRDLVFAKE